MGSAGSNENSHTIAKVRILGETIGKRGLILISGTCPGLPYESAIGRV